jgi:hypothetical protein
MVRWKILDKLMYIKYIIDKILMAIGPHVFYSWNITKQTKTEKMIQCSFVKSPPFSYGNFFSFKNNNNAFIIKMQKKHIFEWIFFQNP